MDARCRPSEKLQVVQVHIPDYENDDSARCTACDVKSRMATRRVVYELLGYFFMIYIYAVDAFCFFVAFCTPVVDLLEDVLLRDILSL